MSNYNNVQFISWELNTGPFIAGNAQFPVGWYCGVRDPGPDQRLGTFGQRIDIETRLAFVADAIARAHALCDPSAATLKVFMAPEFLFRGAGGAYLHDLIDGWQGQAPGELGLPAPYDKPWPGLFGGLRALAADARFEDWLFVFGTAVSASFPTRGRDGKQVLDPTRPGEIYNTALIQRGGPAHGADTYVSRKHYISGIDFLRWYGNPGQHSAGSVLPLDPDALVPAEAMGTNEGGALFQIAGVSDGAGTPIDFGIEICLDHACSGGNYANAFGRIRSAGKLVKIQLVPSGGMSLRPDSVRLQAAKGSVAGAYAFNCDGLGNLDGGSGSHTQVWGSCAAGAPPRLQRLFEASSGAAVPGSQVAAVAQTVMVSIGQVPAISLWNNGQGVAGAGHVRVLAPLGL